MKSKNTIKSVVVGIACVVVFGLVSYAFGFFGTHESAMQLIAGAYGSGQTDVDHTGHIAIDLQKKVKASDTTSTELGNINLIVSQKVNTDPSQDLYQISFDGSAIEDETNPTGPTVNVAGDIIFANKMFYIHPTKLPEIPSIDTSKLTNAWFSFDLVSLAQELGGPDQAKQIEDSLNKAFQANAQDRAALAQIFVQHDFVENPRITGEETINGHDVKDVSFIIDKKALADFVTAADEYQAKKVGTAMSAADIADATTRTTALLDTMTIDPIVLGISQADHHVYSIKGRIEIKDPEYDATDPTSFESAIIAFSGTEDYTTPVAITIPATSTPVEKVLQQLFGSVTN